MEHVYMKQKEDEIKLLKCEADFYRSCNAVRQNGYELQQLKNYLVNELLELQKNKGRKTREYAVYAQNIIGELQASKNTLNEELEQVKIQSTTSKELLNEELERMKTDLNASKQKLNKELEQVKAEYMVSKEQLNEELERIKTDLKKFSRTSGAKSVSTNDASVTCTTIAMETISDTQPENSPDANVLQVARIPESNDVIVSESRVPKERELKKKPMARDEAAKTVKRKTPPNSASTVETDQSEDLLIGGASIMTDSKIVLPSSQVSKLDFILPSDKGEKPSMKKRKSAAVELGSGSEADIKQQEIACIKRAKTGKQPAPASKKKSKDIGVKKRALGRPRKKSKANKVPVIVTDDSEQPKSTELNTSTQIVATHSGNIEKKKLGRPRKRKTEAKTVPVIVIDDSEQPKSTELNTSTQVVATHSGNIEDKELLKLLRPKEKKPEETAEIIPTIVADKVPVTVKDDSEQPKSTELNTSTQVVATHSENIENKELQKPVVPKERKPEKTAEIFPTIVPDKVPVTVIDDSEQQKSTELNTSLQDTQMAATHSERIEKKKLGRPRKRKTETKKGPVTVTDDSEQPKSTELNTSTQVAATHSGNIEDKELLKLLRPKEKKPEETAEIFPTIVPDKVPVTVIDDSEQPKSTELNTSTQVAATHSGNIENKELRKPVMPKERKPEETAEIFPTIVPDKVPVTVIDDSEQPKSTELNTSTQVVAGNIEDKKLLKLLRPKEKKPEETAEIIPTIVADKVPVTVIDDSEQQNSTELNTSLQDTQMAATHSERIEKKKLGRPRKRKTETKEVPVTVIDDSGQPKSTELNTSTQVAATHSENKELRKPVMPKERKPEETAEMFPTIVPDKVPVTVIDDSEQPKSTEPNTSTQVAATHSGNIENKELRKPVMPKERKPEETAEIIPTIVPDKVPVTVIDDSEQQISTELNTSLQDTQMAATHSERIEKKELGRPRKRKTETKKVPVTVIDDSEQPKSTELNTSTQVAATHSENIEKKKLGRPKKRKTETKKVPVTVIDDSEQPKSTELNTSTQVVAGNIEDKELLRPKEKKPAEIIPTIVADKVPVTVIDDSEQQNSTELNTSTQVVAGNIEDKELLKLLRPKEKKPEETAEIIPTIVPDKVPVTVIDYSEQQIFTELNTSLQDTQMAATHSERIEKKKLGRPRKRKTETKKVPVTVIDDSEQPKSTELNTSTQVAATHSENIEKKKLGRPKKRKTETKKVPVTVIDDSEQPKSTELNTSTQVVAGNIEDKELLRPKEKKPAEIIPTIVADKVPVTVIDDSEQPKSTELNTSLQDTQMAATHSEKKKLGRPRKRKTETKKVPVTVTDDSEQPKSTELNTSTQVAATHSELRKRERPKEKNPEETAEMTPDDDSDDDGSVSENSYNTPPSSVIKVRPKVNIPVVFISSRTRSRLSFSDHSTIEEERPPPQKKPRKQRKPKLTLKRRRPTVPKVSPELYEQESDLDTMPCEVSPLQKATNENMTTEVRVADNTQSVRENVTIKPSCDGPYSPEIPLQNMTTESVVNEDMLIEPVVMDTSPHMEEPTEQIVSQDDSTLGDKHSEEPATKEMEIHHSQNLNEISPTPLPAVIIPDRPALVPVHVPPTALNKDTSPPPPVNDKKDNIELKKPPTALTKDTSSPPPVNDKRVKLKKPIVSDVPPTALTKDTSPPPPVNDKRVKLKKPIVSDVPPTALTKDTSPPPVNDKRVKLKKPIVSDVPPTALTKDTFPPPPVDDKRDKLKKPIVSDVPPTALTKDTSPPPPVNDKKDNIERKKAIVSKDSEAPRTFTNRLSISENDFTRKSKTHDKFRVPTRKTKKQSSSVDVRKNATMSEATMSQAIKKLPKSFPNNTTSFGYSLVANNSTLPPPPKRRKTVSSVNNSTVSAFQLSIVDDQELPNKKPPIRVHTSGLKTLKLRDTSSLEKSNTS